MDNDESTLIARFRKGDAAAFAQLVGRLGRRVYGVAYRMTGCPDAADSLVQEAFIRLWDHRARFDPTYPAFPWLKRVVVRLCLDHLRSRRRERPLAAAGEPRDARAADPLQAAAGREQVDRVLDAAGRLSGPKREVLLLRMTEGLSYQEIASRLDCSIGTVMSRLHRARGELLRSLTGLLEA